MVAGAAGAVSPFVPAIGLPASIGGVAVVGATHIVQAGIEILGKWKMHRNNRQAARELYDLYLRNPGEQGRLLLDQRMFLNPYSSLPHSYLENPDNEIVRFFGMEDGQKGKELVINQIVQQIQSNGGIPPEINSILTFYNLRDDVGIAHAIRGWQLTSQYAQTVAGTSLYR